MFGVKTAYHGSSIILSTGNFVPTFFRGHYVLKLHEELAHAMGVGEQALGVSIASLLPLLDILRHRGGSRYFQCDDLSELLALRDEVILDLKNLFLIEKVGR